MSFQSASFMDDACSFFLTCQLYLARSCITARQIGLLQALSDSCSLYCVLDEAHFIVLICSLSVFLCAAHRAYSISNKEEKNTNINFHHLLFQSLLS